MLRFLTEKQAQRLRQKEKTEKFSPDEKTGQGQARDLSITDISSMPARGFKAIIIRIPIGLKKRVEDINETINTEKRNNIAEIKSSVYKMKHA